MEVQILNKIPYPKCLSKIPMCVGRLFVLKRNIMKCSISNPYNRISTAQALVLGVVAVIAMSLLAWSGGVVADGYLHYTFAEVNLWRVLASEIVVWLLPTLLLYVAGVAMTRSWCGGVALTANMAFAHILLMLTMLPMLIPVVHQTMTSILLDPTVALSLSPLHVGAIAAMGCWTMALLVLFWVWSYNAWRASFKVRGAWAVVTFVVVQLLCTIAGGYVMPWITQL